MDTQNHIQSESEESQSNSNSSFSNLVKDENKNFKNDYLSFNDALKSVCKHNFDIFQKISVIAIILGIISYDWILTGLPFLEKENK